MIVFAGRLPVDHVLATADDSVATGSATRADTFRFLQEPDAHLETKIGGSKRADRAYIDGVQRVIVFRMSGQHGVTPAIDETEHVVVCDFLAKTNTTRAENAPLIVKGNSRAQLNILRFLDFVLKKTRFARAEIDTELL